MYGYEKKKGNNINFQSNLAKKGKHKDERIVSKRQDARFVQKTSKPMQENVIQRVGEEHRVANDKDVLAVKRGNVRRDIIATKGKSYFLVQQIPNIIDEIIENLGILCKDSNMYGSMGREAKQIDGDIEELKPFIHALVVKYLKVGNCLDFSRLVFSKLVEQNYGKWVYQCSLDKKEKIEGRKRKVIVEYEKKHKFDILNPDTYENVNVKLGSKMIPLNEYIKNNFQSFSHMQIDSAQCESSIKIYGNKYIRERYTISVSGKSQKSIYDHAFVITYPDEVKVISEMDIRKAMVVDSWGGLSPRTLQAFLNYGNPYQADLDTQDIKIEVKQQSQGNPFSFPKIEQMVQGIVARYAEGIKETDPEVQKTYRKARRGEKIDKVYG